MNRIDRLMGIIITLQSRKYVTADYISTKFEISVRTVYRDIKALSELGIPVSFENQRGYFIVQGYFFPPVSFTLQEANALLLMETIAQKFGDKSIQQHYSSAVTKVKSMLKNVDKDKVDFVDKYLKTFQAPPIGNGEFSYLADIQDAIGNRTILQIEYQNGQNVTRRREIEAIGLTYYGFNWHLIAWCWYRKEYRDFKVSRILSLKNTHVGFRKSEHLDINQYVLSL